MVYVDMTGLIVGAGVTAAVCFILGALWAAWGVSDLKNELRETKHDRDRFQRERDYLHKQMPKRDNKGRFV
jgi:hypothetical protein